MRPARPWLQSHAVRETKIYCQLVCTKVIFKAFLYLQFGFLNFWQNNISEKAAHKMLMK